MSDKNLEEKFIQWARLYVATTSRYSLDSSCARTAFKSGYELAQKEMQNDLENKTECELSQLEICKSYCEVYVEDIKKLNTQLKEAEELLTNLQGHALSCLQFPNADKVDLIKAEERARAYLEKWK